METSKPTEAMRAIILADHQHPEIALLPVAGRPLVARQIQWLRAIGCEAIALEIHASAAGSEICRWLEEDDALGAMVKVALGSGKLGPQAIAARAGLPVSAPLLVVPADFLGAGDPTCGLLAGGIGATTLAVAPPDDLGAGLSRSLGEVTLLGAGATEPVEPVIIRVPADRAWAVSVRTQEQAFALGEAALARRLPGFGDRVDPVQIHASEREPGVWIARGAKIEEGAILRAPVLIGVDAVVRAGARVGPSAFVGDRAVIPAGAVLEHAVVAPSTIVGEGLRVERAVLDARGMLDLVSHERVELDDPLLAASRDEDEDDTASVVPRAGALAVLLACAPVLLVASAFVVLLGKRLVRRVSGRRRGRSVTLLEGATDVAWLDAAVRLLDMVRGARSLVGLRPWTGERTHDVSPWLYEDAARGPYGVIRIDDALTPDDASAGERLRARLWYAHSKSLRTDLALVASRLRGDTATA